MNDYENQYERLKRDKNFLEMKIKMVQTELNKIELQFDYLKARDATLTALEKSLPQRIDTYRSKGAPEILTEELQLLSNMLAEEKEKLLKKENDDDKEEF